MDVNLSAYFSVRKRGYGVRTCEAKQMCECHGQILYLAILLVVLIFLKTGICLGPQLFIVPRHPTGGQHSCDHHQKLPTQTIRYLLYWRFWAEEKFKGSWTNGVNYDTKKMSFYFHNWWLQFSKTILWEILRHTDCQTSTETSSATTVAIKVNISSCSLSSWIRHHSDSSWEPDDLLKSS